MTDPWEQATQKLIVQTESNEIVWEANDELCRRRSREFEFLGPAYVTTVAGKKIAVYEFRRFQRDDDRKPLPFTDSSVAIEFVDENYDLEWPWPSPNGRFELLEAIQFQCAHAEEFLKHFLADSATA